MRNRCLGFADIYEEDHPLIQQEREKHTESNKYLDLIQNTMHVIDHANDLRDELKQYTSGSYSDLVSDDSIEKLQATIDSIRGSIDQLNALSGKLMDKMIAATVTETAEKGQKLKTSALTISVTPDLITYQNDKSVWIKLSEETDGSFYAAAVPKKVVKLNANGADVRFFQDWTFSLQKYAHGKAVPDTKTKIGAEEFRDRISSLSRAKERNNTVTKRKVVIR